MPSPKDGRSRPALAPDARDRLAGRTKSLIADIEPPAAEQLRDAASLLHRRLLRHPALRPLRAAGWQPRVSARPEGVLLEALPPAGKPVATSFDHPLWWAWVLGGDLRRVLDPLAEGLHSRWADRMGPEG